MKPLRRPSAIDVTIGGLTGKQFDVQPIPAGRTAVRRPAGVGPRGPADSGDPSRQPDRGVIVIFVDSLHSAGHEAFLAEAMPIIESFQFDVSIR